MKAHDNSCKLIILFLLENYKEKQVVTDIVKLYQLINMIYNSTGKKKRNIEIEVTENT